MEGSEIVFMTLFHYINRNLDHIKLDIKLGIVSSTILRRWEIYCRYDYYRKLENPVSIAVINAADDFKVCESLVYITKKQMEKQI